MRSTKEKAELCRALHAGAEPTLSAACWDVGTAYHLAHVGVPLNAVGLATREFMLGNASEIAAAVDLPVQADLENGSGESPEIVAQTILEAGTTGIVGGSIEDATGRPADPIYPLELAQERIRAAPEAARSLPFPFMLTARADQYLWGRPDLADVIRRAQAFETADAKVPGLNDLVALKSLCDAVSLPVMVLIGADPGGPEEAADSPAGDGQSVEAPASQSAKTGKANAVVGIATTTEAVDGVADGTADANEPPADDESARGLTEPRLDAANDKPSPSAVAEPAAPEPANDNSPPPSAEAI